MKIDISEHKFLDSKTDVLHKDIVKIESEGKWQESERFKKEDGTPVNEFRIDLKIKSGEVRNTTLNWTNVKILVKAFGDETTDWVGKELRAWKTKSEKAKAGFVFLYAPTDWERDDTGEWIIPEGSQDKSGVQEVKFAKDDSEIPFN
jgi:hypothetical protein